MAKSPSLTLPCKQCGYVNEPERVYCHNCGSKLDRSILPKESEVRREKPEKAQRRIKKMTNPAGGGAMREVKAFGKTILYAVVVAGLIQMVREPADVPENKNELATRFVSSELMELANSPQPRALAFSETDLNLVLKQQIKAAKNSPVVPGIQFERAYTKLTPGNAQIGVEQTVWGYPLHAAMGYRPEFQNGTFRPVLISGNIGRLPVHPAVMEYVSYAFPFRKLWAAMKREGEYLQKMQDIRVEQGRVVLVSRGATAAPPAPAH